ncbi:MAG: hypothetical protein PHR25_05870 [Clostridia bacterium]|nr:hypothetical protein [Clostridia bacterium]
MIKDNLMNGGWTTPETYIYIRSLAKIDINDVVEFIKKEHIEIDYTEEDAKTLAVFLKDSIIDRVEDENIKNPVLVELLRESINRINFDEVAEHYINDVIEAVEED